MNIPLTFLWKIDCLLLHQGPFLLSVDHHREFFKSGNGYKIGFILKSEHFLALHLRDAFRELSCQVYNFFSQKFNLSVNLFLTFDHAFFTIHQVIVSLVVPRPRSVSDHQLHCHSTACLTLLHC